MLTGIFILAPKMRLVYTQRLSSMLLGAVFAFADCVWSPQGSFFACRKNPNRETPSFQAHSANTSPSPTSLVFINLTHTVRFSRFRRHNSSDHARGMEGCFMTQSFYPPAGC